MSAAAQKILIADDDSSIRLVLSQAFTRLGYQVRATGNATTLLKWVSDGEGDLVVTDVVMPDENVFDVLPRIRKQRPKLPVIVMSAQNTLLTAVNAAEIGAFDYVPKPFDLDDMTATAKRALSRPADSEAAKAQARALRDERLPLIGRSAPMQEVYRTIARLVGADLTVLILGESGTGKELLARAIHRASGRANHPFVAINCGAIPETLLESELFGHVKGAFTGAVASRPGKFQAADKGTLFLDEIGELPLNLQVKLLRALQERVVFRVGDSKPEKVDIRVVAATNRVLEEEIRAGRFREDLYYRLNVVNIWLPPLRDRGDDVLIIAKALLSKYAEELHSPVRGFTPQALAAIKKHNWPGNIRQLENRLKKALVLCDRSLLGAEDLELDQASENPILPLEKAKEEFQRKYVLEVLERNNGNRTQTARDLGVDPRTIFRYLERENNPMPSGAGGTGHDGKG